MTFSCKNYEFDTDTCAKLKTECIPGRRGCVLEGKVKLSEELQNRLNKLEEKNEERRSRKQSGI
ncbi:MAG: hypothetical protein KKA54_11815 [Proteobacteria bacterium]|nr:hypothetical protein [Pseudomonadota bacterium]MBU0967052.1 hypothetical protein [Pseudomonadota bacterium]